jgi:hypothetical protein
MISMIKNYMVGFITKKRLSIFFIGFLLLFSISFSLEAKSYNFYVDASVAKSGDGSEKKPFKTIGEALEEVKKKTNSIFVENGKYKEDLELGDYTEIYGESENGVIISGKIIMGDETLLQDITARGSYSVVTIKKDADAEIKNCTIRDFEKIGIEALAGGGKLKVSDSKIKNGNGKGFYIQRGKEIEIQDNEVKDNDEEGVDLRSKLTGIVKNNIIVDNGESGIELLVGSTDLKIIGNEIKHNGSSGIATQFYPEHEKKGQIEISVNKLEKNKKYGVDCNKPQGGSPGNSYWRDSIELESNDINANKIKSINDYCKMIEAVDEEEEIDNTIEEEGYEEAEEKDIEAIEPELNLEEQERIKREEEAERKIKEEKLNSVHLVLANQNIINANLERNIEEINKENSVKIFFFGLNSSHINSFRLNLNSKEEQLLQAEKITEEIFLEADEYTTIQERIEKEKEILEEKRDAFNNQIDIFSLWGWITNFFK